MYLDRNWKISENEKIDSVIARVQAHDNEQDILTFGLEVDELNGSIGDVDDTLPFRIDPNTGIVYLNNTLEGRGGENFFLYVTVSDGTLTAKNQVYVNIKSKNDQRYNSGPPPFTPHATNITRLLPPFHLLPGVPPKPSNLPMPTSFPRPPFNIQTKTYPEPNSNTSDGNQNDDDNNTDENVASNNPHNNNKKNKTNEMPFTTDSNSIGLDQNSTLNTTNTFLRAPLKTVLPIAIIICGIIIASALIVSTFIFRKRLCAIGKSLKNKSKEEMAKKSNQSNSTVLRSSVSEDSRNSIVMQHWNGPMAFSNRYVPWERESPHIQVCFSI